MTSYAVFGLDVLEPIIIAMVIMTIIVIVAIIRHSRATKAAIRMQKYKN